MKLKLFAATLTLCKLRSAADRAGWRDGEPPLHVVIDDPHGQTVICNEAFSQKRSADIVDQSRWRCFQIDEFFEVDSVGIVSEFSTLLAAENISVFVISSYETDYLLVMPHQTDRATAVFESAGHVVEFG